MSYKDDVQEALDLQPGDVVGTAFRSNPLIPTQQGVTRGSFTGFFVAWVGESIVIEKPGGSVFVEPISDVYVSRPDDEQVAKLRREKMMRDQERESED